LAETIRTEWALWVISYGGIAFDFLIVPALLWKRTRAIAVLCAVGFHVSNVFLFNIGVFPWLMLAATTLFFDPWWPRRIPGWDRLGAADLSLVLRRLREFLQTPRSRLRWGAFVGGMLVLFPLLAVSSAFAVALHAMVRSTAPAAAERPKGSPVYDAIDLLPRRIVIFFCVWLAAQLLIPLRHHLYPGNVAWTEEGHMFSWRMKLRSKRGSVRFHAEDRQSGRRWEVDPRQELSSRQIRKMAGRPDFIRQYAVHLAERYRQQGLDVKVTAEARTSLNYRKRRTFIDPEVDLGRERGSILPYRWVTDMPDDPVPER
jgi:hypothetical protein